MKCAKLNPIHFLGSIQAVWGPIFYKNPPNLKKVVSSAETPDLPFLVSKFPTILSFLGNQWTDFGKQGKNIT